jgi:hypothetical protein
MLDQTVLHRIEMGVCPATSTGNRLSGHSRESSADAALPVSSKAISNGTLFS